MVFAGLLITALAAGTATIDGEVAAAARHDKPRVIVMTDGEIDDQSSMIRFLLYTNDIDLAAVIETNSVWQRSGHSKEDWYERQLAAYEKIHPNLIRHDPDYPTAAEIRARSFVGDEDPDHLIEVASDAGRRAQVPGGKVEYRPGDWPDTPGSDRIVQVLLEPDPEPVHIQAWGGGNTAARAFHKLKTAHPHDYQRAVAKAVVYNISYQDDAGNYIETHHPGVTMLYSGAFHKSWAYDVQTDTAGFIAEEIRTGHGPLGALYPQSYVSEGDTPAFLYTVPNGLRNYENPTYGGWGGRFVKLEGLGNVYADARDDGDILKPLTRWVAQANNDFAARMDWAAAATYSEANHHPVVNLAGPTDVVAAPGQTLVLSAAGTRDPDLDRLSYKWWIYEDAGSFDGAASLSDAGSEAARLTIGDDAKAGTVHIILEVADDGKPRLVSYARIIVTVAP